MDGISMCLLMIMIMIIMVMVVVVVVVEVEVEVLALSLRSEPWYSWQELYIIHLKTKRRLLYLKTQSVPRSEQISSRL